MGLDAVLTVGALLGVGVVVVLFVAGYLSATPGATGVISTPGPGPDASCDALCAAWNTVRSGACAAIAASTAADSALISANATLRGATLMAALLLAAAVAASLIPFIGPAIAGPLFAAYATAQAAAIVLLGRQAAAAAAASAAAAAVSDALSRVAAAREDLVTRCPDPMAVSRCLATPSPCVGVP